MTWKLAREYAWKIALVIINMGHFIDDPLYQEAHEEE